MKLKTNKTYLCAKENENEFKVSQKKVPGIPMKKKFMYKMGITFNQLLENSPCPIKTRIPFQRVQSISL
jgi:hypothetical protein